MKDDCENFLRSASRNETFWCGECAHIPVLGQMIMIPSSSSLGCKVFHSPPFCVANCGGQIYYVVHRLQSMSRMVIHLGVHNHPVTNGKCWEVVKEIRRLIIEKVDRMPNAKIFLMSLSASKTFLVNYLLDYSSDSTMELFKGEQLEHIQYKFYELSSPNIYNLVVFFKHHSRGGYIDNILQLNSKNRYNYI